MGKNKRKQIQCFDSFHNAELQMDSIEECDFLEWCIEATQLGILKDFLYQPPSIKLFDAVDYISLEGKKKSLLREHVYSPDFTITIDSRHYKVLSKPLKLSSIAKQQDAFQVILDVKGTFQKSDGGRAFSLNQKWVHQKTGIYVVKVVPKDFFKMCGCPQACFKTRKTGKTRKAFEGCPSIKDAFGL